MNKIERAIYDELHPRSSLRARLMHFEDMAIRRLNQQLAAEVFLLTGEQKGSKPPHGDEWSREYNPVPYPEARPEDPEYYQGTGIGFLYGTSGCLQHAWQMAGWNLVRTGSEARRRARAGSKIKLDDSKGGKTGEVRHSRREE